MASLVPCAVQAVGPCMICYNNKSAPYCETLKLTTFIYFYGETMKWFFLALSRYAVFSGRSQRAEFGYFVVMAALIELALFMVDQSMAWTYSNGDWGLLSSVASVVFFIPSITVATRRLHDIGKSGWWQLLVFTGVGILVLIYWFALNGHAGANAYGPNPKEVGHF
jgi:uncharacterized membrane protein YhaH (DUF805 family)